MDNEVSRIDELAEEDRAEQVRKLANDILIKQLEDLGKCAVGCEDSKGIIDDFVTLQKSMTEAQKAQNEAEKIKADRELEEKKQEAEMDFKKKNARIEHLLQFGGIVAQLAGFGITAWSTIMNIRASHKNLKLSLKSARSNWLDTLKYEEKGSITSFAGKSIAGDCLRSRK